jgi:hypothetical protein
MQELASLAYGVIRKAVSAIAPCATNNWLFLVKAVLF